MSLGQAHIMRQDNAILALHQNVRQISRQLEQTTNQFMPLQRAQEPSDHGDEQGF